MKHFLLISLVAVSSLFLGGCQLVKNTAVNNNSTTSAPTSQTNTSSTSLKDLLNLGKNEKCTWSVEINGKMDGTLYISGKKFKQEVIITDSNTQTTNQFYSLSDGTFLYTWNSAMGNQGFKIDLNEEIENATDNTPISDAPNQNQGTVDLTQQYQYQCQPWAVDESKFTPPTDIIFTDMSDQIKQLNDLQKKLRQ